MKTKPSTLKTITILLATCVLAMPLAGLAATSIASNHSTSASLLVDSGWSCIDEQADGFDLNSRHFKLLYEYLENRAIRHRIRAEHVICELGTPIINRRLEENLKVIGFNAIAGEQLLIYGTDISSSSKEKNVLIVFIEPQGLVRQILWAKPDTQSMIGVQVDFSNSKFSKLKGTYKNLEANDVFK